MDFRMQVRTTRTQEGPPVAELWIKEGKLADVQWFGSLDEVEDFENFLKMLLWSRGELQPLTATSEGANVTPQETQKLPTAQA